MRAFRSRLILPRRPRSRRLNGYTHFSGGFAVKKITHSLCRGAAGKEDPSAAFSYTDKRLAEQDFMKDLIARAAEYAFLKAFLSFSMFSFIFDVFEYFRVLFVRRAMFVPLHPCAVFTSCTANSSTSPRRREPRPSKRAMRKTGPRSIGSFLDCVRAFSQKVTTARYEAGTTSAAALSSLVALPKTKAPINVAAVLAKPIAVSAASLDAVRRRI